MLGGNEIRKSKIRTPKKAFLSQVDYEKSWEQLDEAIKQIYQKNASTLSFEELYRKTYNLVLRKQGKFLYDNIYNSIKSHLENDVRPRMTQFMEDDKIDKAVLLQNMSTEWNDHLLSMRMISDFAMYLDRVYVKEAHLPLIYDIGLQLFRDYVILPNDNIVGKKIIGLLLQSIDEIRSNKIVDKFLIKNIIFMFESLPDEAGNYYDTYVEPDFLEDSRLYFEKVSSELLLEQNGSLFINNIIRLIEEEQNRTALYLPLSTLPKLVELMDKALIATNIEAVLAFENEGLSKWVAAESVFELNSLYKLIGRIDEEYHILRTHLKRLLISFGEALDESTSKTIADGPDTPKKKATTHFVTIWIESILTQRDVYERILQNCFNRDIHIAKTIDASFALILNANKRISEYLSLYIDHFIKQSLKEKSENESEEILTKAVAIFSFIHDKDVFEKYYKNHLAKRLLNPKSNSYDIERNLISKFKSIAGETFVSKLSSMFRDINISKEESKQFQVQLQQDDILPLNNNKKVSMDVNVLTHLIWPLPLTETNVQFPEILFNLKEQYAAFYAQKHQNRKFNWAPNFGTVDMRMTYGRKTYEVNMPTYSAIIILALFSTDYKAQYTYAQIHQELQIPENDLKRQLLSISVAPKTRLLVKRPMSKEINPEDIFQINEKFQSPQIKIKVLTVSTASKLENDQQRSSTLTEVNKDRKFETDAAIVRIMKARKTLTHNNLMNETIKQLANRFSPPPSLIKQRIESLLEKEYMERDSKERNLYHYLA
ncbi:Ubiquitin-protein ligase [Komagataella phaffii CBS 7435]|uniref:Ubiquitin-protein ligase, member of the cullin family with similarity to Cdc53p and human CUL3 n=2 Tax=Komagataella phaffii TaxID=460519 RepID=C4R0G6_KOMPG|nr:uncharacterized protein PAS_chr2-1_0369 [Komagataella phaffii GS115]CAH2448493.1 Ubiquitin-protein ligase [Komagataella phaffii CBS 7435]CAY68990.1 Ubiquitin-protein ligase, member of the cullin family with similarity to Cdc53p and human CUL3 [Komagataella phaffii GS115]CCA38612.1 Ubiquitin-protein ligase [Komagataella phaffii CBS 7435]